MMMIKIIITLIIMASLRKHPRQALHDRSRHHWGAVEGLLAVEEDVVLLKLLAYRRKRFVKLLLPPL